MNEHGHLTEDALLDTIYGIAGPETETHLHACAECTDRSIQWREKASAADGSEITDEFLAAQRRTIYARIERPAPRRWWWAPAAAMAGALLIGIFAYQPYRLGIESRRAAMPAGSEISDSQLFSDVYTLERTPEPSATAPVRALFEDQAQ